MTRSKKEEARRMLLYSDLPLNLIMGHSSGTLIEKLEEMKLPF